jgi:hypothetical protein
MRSNLWDVVVAFDLARTGFRRIQLNFLYAYGWAPLSILRHRFCCCFQTPHLIVRMHILLCAFSLFVVHVYVLHLEPALFWLVGPAPLKFVSVCGGPLSQWQPGLLAGRGG